jgi:hypothetical protein
MVGYRNGEKMRKVSIRTIEGDIGLARSVANGTTKWPFLGYCADQMERMLEEIKESRKKKTWQSLTDDEIKEIVGGYGNKGGIGDYTRELFDKIEAKIREKNERKPKENN